MNPGTEAGRSVLGKLSPSQKSVCTSFNTRLETCSLTGREAGKGDREGERHRSVVSHTYPIRESNTQPLWYRDDAPTTEPPSHGQKNIGGQLTKDPECQPVELESVLWSGGGCQEVPSRNSGRIKAESPATQFGVDFQSTVEGTRGHGNPQRTVGTHPPVAGKGRRGTGLRGRKGTWSASPRSPGEGRCPPPQTLQSHPEEEAAPGDVQTCPQHCGLGKALTSSAGFSAAPSSSPVLRPPAPAAVVPPTITLYV